MPIVKIPEWIDAEASKKEKLQTGIPIDSLNNQLNTWVRLGRELNPNAEAAVKGDASSDYKVAKKVFDVLQANNVNRFNLTTTLIKVEAKLPPK
jgi:biopolymer transport protein ExbD